MCKPWELFRMDSSEKNNLRYSMNQFPCQTLKCIQLRGAQHSSTGGASEDLKLYISFGKT